MSALILAVRLDWDEMSEHCESEEYVARAWLERNAEVFSRSWEGKDLML